MAAGSFKTLVTALEAADLGIGIPSFMAARGSGAWSVEALLGRTGGA
jgi:hypothetical protein